MSNVVEASEVSEASEATAESPVRTRARSHRWRQHENQRFEQVKMFLSVNVISAPVASSA